MSLLVSDFDGTFYKDEKGIEINCRAVNDFIKRGNYFMLSTGRPFDSIKEKIEKYNIPCNYVGTSDGSFLLNSNGDLIEANTISHRVIEDLKEFTELNCFERIQYAYPHFNLLEYEKNGQLGSIAYVMKKENITEEVLTLFNKLKIKLPYYKFDIYGYDNTYYFLVRPISVSKSKPIEGLSKKLNIPKEEIYTIGDNGNDIEMIRDYNGYRIGDNKEIIFVSLKQYNSVNKLIEDINKKKVLKRW